MLLVRSQSASADIEQLALGADRLLDLLAGARALLDEDAPAQHAVKAAKETICVSLGVLDEVREMIEALNSRRAAAERAERAHKAEAARMAGGAR
jgi:hypothetical protein